MRSARSFTCETDSSPETYKILIVSNFKATCNISVDLPTPGSPPTKITDPGTIPPPKTLSNS